MPIAASTDIIYSAALTCPPDDVWRALTATNQPRSWMWNSTLRGMIEPDGDYALSADGENLVVGTVQDALAPYRLVMSYDARWDQRVAEEPAGELEYLITPTSEHESEFSVRLSGLTGCSANAAERDIPEIYSRFKVWLEETDGA